MASISGNVTVAGDPDDWIACAFDANTHAFAGVAAVSSGTYEVTGLTAGKAYVVACRPKSGPAWTASASKNTGDLVIPADPVSDPYIFEAAVTDAAWAEVIFQLGFSGSNNGTTFIDDKGASITRLGTAVTSTAEYKWAPSSLRVPSSSSGLYVASESPYRLGTDDFTIECWAWLDASHGIGAGGIGSFLAKYITGTNNRSYELGFLNDAGTTKIAANLSTAGTSANLPLRGGAFTTQAWHHFALVRSGNDFSIYLDGTLEDTDTLTGSLYDASGAALGIGTRADTSGGGAFAALAYYDDVRMTLGTASYTGSSFTPPAGAFVTPVTGATEPSWPATPGNTVEDGGITWTNMGRLVRPLMHGPLIAA